MRFCNLGQQYMRDDDVVSLALLNIYLCRNKRKHRAAPQILCTSLVLLTPVNYYEKYERAHKRWWTWAKHICSLAWSRVNAETLWCDADEHHRVYGRVAVINRRGAFDGYIRFCEFATTHTRKVCAWGPFLELRVMMMVLILYSSVVLFALGKMMRILKVKALYFHAVIVLIFQRL